jgi:hypothetical protein
VIGVRFTLLERSGPFERIERLISVETGVGKSTLHRRLTGDRYVPYQPPTTLHIPYRVQTLQIAGLPVTLHRTSKPWPTHASIDYG